MMGVELLFIILLPFVFIRTAIDLALPVIVLIAVGFGIFFIITSPKETVIKVIVGLIIAIPLIIGILYSLGEAFG